MIGTPAGGTFAGPGVSGTTFDPALAGAGIHTITYSFTDANGCSATANTTITVNALPVVDAGTYPASCINAGAIALIGTPAGGTFAGPGVSGTTFDPALAGAGIHTITYSFTDANGCSATANTTITVSALPTVTIDPVAAMCADALPLTLVGTPAGGTFTGPGISGNTFDPVLAGSGTHNIVYNYTDPTGCNGSASIDIVVNALPSLSINAVPAVCVSSPVQTLSSNPAGGSFSGPGVTGTTFDPAIAGAGNHTITCDITDANGCRATATTIITVNADPAVDAGTYSDVCINGSAVSLVGSPAGGSFSGPGVSGTTFDPALAGTGIHTITYNYTDPAGCSGIGSTTITVNALPVVDAGTYANACINEGIVSLVGSPTGGIFSGPGVSGNNFDPTISGVGIHTITYTYTDPNGCSNSATTTITVVPIATSTTGVAICSNQLPFNWNNNSYSAAGTYTVTLTSAAGCDSIATLNLTVVNQTMPTFGAIGPYCLNSVAPPLPVTSIEGLSGTWNPATVNTSIPGPSTYTFTPSSGQCTGPASVVIVITDQIIPTFDPIADVCLNATAPVLPTTSLNNITGSWAPAVSTATVGTTTYTFTPDPGQCAAPAQLTITVTDQLTPTFDPIADVCLNATAPVLPTTSLNNITGSWAPAVSTATVGTTTYTFTPDPGQCAAPAQLTITVTDQLTPTFDPIADVCLNATAPVLPTTSLNNITGSWAPAVSTATVGTTTYTFTPDPGQCAAPAQLTITVTDQLTPTFDPIADVCLNSTAPVLPTTSLNNITGSWAPAVSTATVGTTTYTFTPDPGQCAAPAQLTITVTDQLTPTFDPIADVCLNATAPVLPTTSLNNITGSWAPAVSTGSCGHYDIYIHS